MNSQPWVSHFQLSVTTPVQWWGPLKASSQTTGTQRSQGTQTSKRASWEAQPKHGHAERKGLVTHWGNCEQRCTKWFHRNTDATVLPQTQPFPVLSSEAGSQRRWAGQVCSTTSPSVPVSGRQRRAQEVTLPPGRVLTRRQACLGCSPRDPAVRTVNILSTW